MSAFISLVRACETDRREGRSTGADVRRQLSIDYRAGKTTIREVKYALIYDWFGGFRQEGYCVCFKEIIFPMVR